MALAPRLDFLLTSASARLRRAGPASLAYVGSFGAAKLIAYAAPLVLAFYLPPADYVSVEYALALGAVGGMLLGLGLPSAIPQFALYRQPPARLFDVVGLQAGGFGLLLAAGALAYLWAGGAAASALIPLMIAAYLFQYAFYNHALTYHRASSAVWVSNLTILLALAAGMAAWLSGGGEGASVMIPAALITAAVVLVMAAVCLVLALRQRQPAMGPRLAAALRFGAPVALNGMIATWSVSTIRIYTEWALPNVAGAALLFDFRIASALILVHQLVATALFRKIYVVEARRLDLWVLGYFIVALAGALVFSGAMNLPFARTLLDATGARSEGFTGLVTIFVLLWSVTAFFDTLVIRSGRALRVALINGAVAVAAVLVVRSGVLGPLTPDGLAMVCCAQLALVALAQTLCLPAHERPWRSLAAVAVTFAGGLVYLLAVS